MAYVANAIRTIRAMSPAEQLKVLKVSGEHVDGFRDHMIISIALGTALRLSEIGALDVGDVARSSREIRTRVQLRQFAEKGRKGKPAAAKGRNGVAAADKTQRVFLNKMVRLKLLKFLAWKKRRGEPLSPDSPLFYSERKGRLSLRALRWIWREWQKRAGIETLYSFHEIRHTSLTNLYRATRDVLLVQRAARHRHVTSTQIYAHVSDEDVRRGLDEIAS